MTPYVNIPLARTLTGSWDKSLFTLFLFGSEPTTIPTPKDLEGALGQSGRFPLRDVSDDHPFGAGDEMTVLQTPGIKHGQSFITKEATATHWGILTGDGEFLCSGQLAVPMTLALDRYGVPYEFMLSSFEIFINWDEE